MAPRKTHDFIEAALSSNTDDCIVWPYAKTRKGYPNLHRDGRTLQGNSFICEISHGPRPDKHEAAHSCGVRLCINPRHLRWATAKENSADRLLHGTHQLGERNHSAKITADQARLIKRSDNWRELAKEVGISEGQARHIRRGLYWIHI